MQPAVFFIPKPGARFCMRLMLISQFTGVDLQTPDCKACFPLWKLPALGPAVAVFRCLLRMHPVIWFAMRRSFMKTPGNMGSNVAGSTWSSAAFGLLGQRLFHR